MADPLEYLYNFWRSLEMSLINCKAHLEFNWTEKCVISDINDNATFKITNKNYTFPQLLCQLTAL